MQTFILNYELRQKRHQSFSVRLGRKRLQTACLLLLAGVMALSGCGGSSQNHDNVINLTGNWQFTTANPSDQSFIGGIQGGFMQEKSGALTGGAVYSVALPSQSGGNPTVCNSGSATITGTVDGQNVTITAVAGTQTFTFIGILNLTGTIITGTYNSTAGTATDGVTPCGTSQTGLQWSAASLPPLTGTFTGSFHSTAGNATLGNESLGNQVFPVTAVLTQGTNIGASNATVTGSLSFADPITSVSDYPCFGAASVNGQVSGSVVTLQIIGLDGTNYGQIGGTITQQLGTVTFDSTTLGYVLHSLQGNAYAVSTPTCPGGGSITSPGDTGNICLSTSATACQQPVLITPGSLIFTPQVLGSAPTTQKVTITNNAPSNATLDGLVLNLSFGQGSLGGLSDFNGLSNYSEQDNCADSLGATFSLAPLQSCTVTVSFSPQEGCSWIPFPPPGAGPSMQGTSPASCPVPLNAILRLNSPSSVDTDTNFSVSITGYGLSEIQPSTGELDFGAVAITQSSLPQLLSFTNHGSSPVQILGSAPCLNNPPATGNTFFPYPLQLSSSIAGLQVVANGTGSPGGNITQSSPTIIYSCDSDPTSQMPNFQITADTCTGMLLAPQATCSLQIAYVPQPSTPQTSGLDFFLELNTVQCSSLDGVTSNCEIDGGRFPVELRSNPASPLRMSPGAGLDFGTQTMSNGGGKQKITIFNDPNDPNAGTITFSGKVVVKGDYSETDDCPFSLAPGAGCTLTIGFKPKIIGYDPGTITINYTPEPNNAPQVIYLRGTGGQ